MRINWTTTKRDREAIERIVDRACLMAARAHSPRDRMTLEMDLIACHMNDTRLDLHALETADDFNFSHDVFGIERHINRDTGKLERFFVPRFALRQVATGRTAQGEA